MSDVKMPTCVWPEWKFVKLIGRGAYGAVYEAVHLDHEFQVEDRAAIKVISIPQEDMGFNPYQTMGMGEEDSKAYLRNLVDDFVNEIKMMIAFRGMPNIVSVYDYKVVERAGGVGWNISIRMELLTPLNRYAADRTLKEEEVIKLGTDICSALEVCARNHVIHRDIKPANIFVNPYGDFKLGDFGIAKQLEELTADFSRKGTGSYMAPEVEQGKGYNASADLYSLGLVLYYLMNQNQRPFLDPGKPVRTPAELEHSIHLRLSGTPLPPPCNASKEMTDIILCACAYDPKDRFKTATAMKHALETVGTPQKAAETPTHPKKEEPESTAPRKQKKRAIWIVVICVVAAVIACSYYGVRTGRANRYDELVRQQAEYREAGDAVGETVAYEEAVNLLSSNPETYYQHARTFHEVPADGGTPDYSACIKFVENDILKNAKVDLANERMADIYYLYADSLFQTGDYSSAVAAYQKLFNNYDTEQPLYYRDYAIALAYDGRYDDAGEALREAEDLGLGNDSVYYTKGEIEVMSSDVDQALEDFSSCIRFSQDEDLIAHAYLSIANLYKERGDREAERATLLEARQYESTKLPQILQNLIQVDMDLADEAAAASSRTAETGGQDALTASLYRQDAIDTLNQVVTNGWETFTTYNNLIILYQQEEELDRAEETLLSIVDTYGEDYRWYKRYAFLEIYKQNDLENETRDYHTFEEYYEGAQERYLAYLQNGGSTDSEMSVLDKDYQEIKSGGWLTE